MKDKYFRHADNPLDSKECTGWTHETLMEKTWDQDHPFIEDGVAVDEKKLMVAIETARFHYGTKELIRILSSLSAMYGDLYGPM